MKRITFDDIAAAFKAGLAVGVLALFFGGLLAPLVSQAAPDPDPGETACARSDAGWMNT